MFCLIFYLKWSSKEIVEGKGVEELLRIYVKFNEEAGKDEGFMDEALSFEGQTGPYIQYTCARAKSVLRKCSLSGKSVDWKEDKECTESV